jgi:hypothetical protein
MTMGAGKLRVFAVRGGAVILAAAAAALAAGCGSVTASQSGTGQAELLAASAPELGKLTLGSFPATTDGNLAQMVCQEWAGLRGDYAAQLHQDTPFQLEVWFSTSTPWLVAFNAESPLKSDNSYIEITTSFGLASTAAAASIANARLLDKACAAAD